MIPTGAPIPSTGLAGSALEGQGGTGTGGKMLAAQAEAMQYELVTVADEEEEDSEERASLLNSPSSDKSNKLTSSSPSKTGSIDSKHSIQDPRFGTKANQAAATTEGASAYVSETIQETTFAGKNVILDPNIKSCTLSAATTIAGLYNKNQATEIPPPNNAYAVLADSEIKATEQRMETLDATVTGNNYLADEQVAAFDKQIEDIKKSIKAQEKAEKAGKKSKAMGDMGMAMGITMIIVGVILTATGVGAGLGTALIVGGVVSTIMSSDAGEKINTATTNMLMGQPFNASSQDAMIGSIIIITGVSIALSAAAATTTSVAQAASSVATAIQNAASSIASSLSAATTMTSAQMATAVANATKSAMQAASQAVDDALRAIAQASKDALASIAQSYDDFTLAATRSMNDFSVAASNAASQPAATARATLDAAAKTMSEAVTNAARATTESMTALAQSIQSMPSTLAQSIDDASAAATRASQMSWQEVATTVAQSVTATGQKLANMPALTALQLSIGITSIVLDTVSAVAGFEAGLKEYQATLTQADLLMSKAYVDLYSQQIEVMNSSIQQQLNMMNAGIATTGSTLAGNEIPM